MKLIDADDLLSSINEYFNISDAEVDEPLLSLNFLRTLISLCPKAKELEWRYFVDGNDEMNRMRKHDGPILVVFSHHDIFDREICRKIEYYDIPDDVPIYETDRIDYVAWRPIDIPGVKRCWRKPYSEELYNNGCDVIGGIN